MGPLLFSRAITTPLFVLNLIVAVKHKYWICVLSFPNAAANGISYAVTIQTVIWGGIFLRRFQNREQLSSLSWPEKIRTFGNTNANGEAVRKENFTSSVGIKYAKNSLALLQATFWGPLHQTPSAGSLVLCSRTCACDPKINLLASYPPFADLQTLRKRAKLRRSHAREMERTGTPNP